VLRAQAGLGGERGFLAYRPPLSGGVSPGALRAAQRDVPTGSTPAALDRLRFVAAHETLRQATLATTRITWNDVATRYTTAIAILEQARAADLVVICWGSATHAATDAIRGVVDAKRIRYPSGNGSSSVIREIANVIREAA